MKLAAKQASYFSKYTEQDHSDRVYRKVGKDMDYPRGVDSIAFAVEDIKYHSSDEECKDDKCCQPKRIPTDHHRDMIEREADRAENARTFDSYFFRESDESESAEDKFFEEGIANSNIESDKHKILFCNSYFVKRRGDTRKIKIFSEQEIRADYKAVHKHAECEHRKKRFLIRLKET